MTTLPEKATRPDNVTRLRSESSAPRSQGPESGDDRMLFWAERDPAAIKRSIVLMLLLMAPLAFLAPAAFIAAAVGAVAAAALNARSFQFQLTAHELRLRAAALSPVLRLKLSDIAGASILPDPGGFLVPMAPRSGHLLIKKTDGGQLLVPGLKDVDEAVEAIHRLKHPPTEGAIEAA